MTYLKSVLLSTILLVTVSALASDKIITTVIIVDGIPKLVDIDEFGDVVKTYTAMPSYFTSDLGHDDFVTAAIEKYESNFVSIAGVQMVPYDALDDLVMESAVDRIRAIAVFYESSKNTKIYLTAHKGEGESSEHNTQVNKMTSLLMDFGVSEDDIIVKQKIFKGEEVFPFVKVETSEE